MVTHFISSIKVSVGLLLINFFVFTNPGAAEQTCVTTSSGNVVCGVIQPEKDESYRYYLDKKDGEWTYSKGRPSGRPYSWDVVEINWDLGEVIKASVIEANVQIGWNAGCTDRVNLQISKNGKLWSTVKSQVLTTRSAESGWAYTNLGTISGDFEFRYVRVSELEKNYGRACALDDVKVKLFP